MKLAWLNDIEEEGYVHENDTNQRTDKIWQNTLHTYRYFWPNVPYKKEELKQYDAILFTIPKTNPSVIHIVNTLLALGPAIILVQEGPCDIFMDWNVQEQAMFFELLQNVDGIFTHGKTDKNYYQGITGRKCYTIPTLMDENIIKHIQQQPKKEGRVIIGGNLCRWYGGSASVSTVRQNLKIKTVLLPSMGRKIPNEEILASILSNKDIEYLPYTNWVSYMGFCSQAQYAIHLMPVAGAGSFNLGCAILGIPCIGNQNTDTQRICFPDLSIDVMNVQQARQLLDKLTNDKDFYTMVSKKAIKNSKQFYTQTQKNNILNNIQEIIKTRGNKND